jgi:hypothetical protein
MVIFAFLIFSDNKISHERWTKAGSNLGNLSFVILMQSALVVVDWSSFTLSLIYKRMSQKFITSTSVQSTQILQLLCLIVFYKPILRL